MKKQLTSEEVDKLFDFVKSKNVVHLDTQLEIVDHIAAAIEELMDSEDSLSFSDALTVIYNKFPVTGFAEIVAAKDNTYTTYWLKQIGTHILSTVLSKYIVVIIPVSYLIYFALSQNHNGYTLTLLAFIFSVLAINYGNRMDTANQLSEDISKDYLSYKCFIYTIEWLNILISIPLVILIVFLIDINMGIIFSPLFAGFTTIYITFALLWSCLLTYQFPPMVTQHIMLLHGKLKAHRR